MSDSLFTGPELSKRANVTGAHLIEHGVVRETEPYLSPDPLGAAGVQSSAADMAKWLRMLLDKGTFEGKAVVKSDTIAEVLKPQMLLASIGYPAARQAKPNFYAYGLGWFLQDYKGRLLAMHTGSLYGANAIVALVPEERLGLVILVNAGPVDFRHAFMYDVIDRFLRSRDKDWNADLLKLYGGLQAEEDARRAAGGACAAAKDAAVAAAGRLRRQVLRSVRRRDADRARQGRKADARNATERDVRARSLELRLVRSARHARAARRTVS